MEVGESACWKFGGEKEWLDRRTGKFLIGEIAGTNVAAELEHFEADLVVLLKNHSTARNLKAMEIVLPALARDGSIRWRPELVLPNKSVERLALPKRFLLKNKSRAAVLDKLSPTRLKPTVIMLVTAFEEDSENIGALQARLKQFLESTEPGDEARNRVATMAILPLDGQLHAPRDLAFKGSKGDYWGTWKIRIPATELSQDEQLRYRKIGVTPSVPTTSEASRAFLGWLSEQDADILRSHISCVVRHILHPNGPVAWAETYTDKPFIPAQNRDDLRLVSLQFARRQPVYLPDIGQLADHVTDRDPDVLLVIARVKEVQEPIAERLRGLGVRSLREAIGEPSKVAGSGTIQEAPEELLKTVEILRSRKFRREFRKRLDELDVEFDLVRRDWHDRISRITAIRFAQEVEAEYRFRRRRYRIPVDAGFDPVSGVFWVKDKQRDAVSGFYKAMAAQLVFKPTARRVHLLALAPTLDLEIRDPTFGLPGSWTVDETEEETIDTYEEDGRDGGDGETGEAVLGHSPFEPNPLRNIPQPGPIPSSTRAGTKRREGVRGRSSKPSGGDDDRTPGLEREHKERLKTEHYASHCQMCLCERLPSELAPQGSYVEWEEVRRLVVKAHHVDPKSGLGARHAGNLIVLCELHHNNYGRRLTRQAVTAALRKRRKKKTLRFGGNDGYEPEVNGRVIRVVIADSGEIVPIFFTEEHVEYWLSQVQPAV